MEEIPASHLVHEHRADVDPAVLRVTEVTAASRRIRMEVDRDRGGLDTRTFEPRHGPPREVLVGRILCENHDPRPDFQPGLASPGHGPSPAERRQGEDRGSEPTDRAHRRTLEPGSCAPGV